MCASSWRIRAGLKGSQGDTSAKRRGEGNDTCLEDEAVSLVAEVGDETIQEAGHLRQGPELLSAHAEGL